VTQAAIQPHTITILDKEFVLGCPENERENLDAAARYLNTKMREVRDTGKVVGADRIAVMAAVNIAYDLLQAQKSLQHLDQNVGVRMRSLNDKIDKALSLDAP
jgi:cell division protein ZapA